jgi:hypothetical protein
VESETITAIQSKMKKGDYQSLVDAPFTTFAPVSIDLGAIVLIFKNDATQTFDRIALSRTEPAAGAVRASNKPFRNIRIPFHTKDNAIVEAYETGNKQVVTDWKYLFNPELSTEEARDNQRGAGVQTSVVQPFSGSNVDGALIFSFLCPETALTEEHIDFIDTFQLLIEHFL